MSKTKIKKVILLWAVCIASVLLCIFICSIAKSGVIANGPEVFQMVNSASIRLDGNGLRFKVKMSETVKNTINYDDVNLYFIIMPEKYLSELNGNYQMAISRTAEGKFDVDNSRCVYVRVNGNIYDGNDGYYYANGGISDVQSANLKESFVAIGCIETKTAGEYSYRYADFPEGINRYPATHLYNAINKAMLYEEENYYNAIAENYDWYGGENYPVYIDTQEGYNEFAMKINQGYDFSAFNVEITTAVRLSGAGVTSLAAGKSLPANTTHYCSVKFYDGNGGTIIKEDVVESGEKVAAIAEPKKESDVRTEYVFLYWQYNGERWDFDVDIVEDNIELIAVWEKHTYSVDFEL